MDYGSWVESVPATITGDPLWKAKAYRLALFISDIAWADVAKLAQGYPTRGLSDQLYRALGSISANIAEGYSRSSGHDRARLYEYALGSARESRDWYFKARHVLGEDVVEHRLAVLTEIICLLITMVPDQRTRNLKEESSPYTLDADLSLE